MNLNKVNLVKVNFRMFGLIIELNIHFNREFDPGSG